MVADEPPPDVPLVDLDDISPDDTLAADVRRKRITTPLTRVLLAIVVVGVAMLGGALLDRWQRPASSGSSSLAAIAAQFRNGGPSGASGGSGASGANGAGGLGGGATIGTVKLVDGTNVYVTDLQGKTVKVTTKPSTTVSVTKTGKTSDLAPGSTVIVQGKQSSDGASIAATSISQSTGFGGAAGLGSGRGLDGGGLGGGAVPGSGAG
jgi:hypothetical protein